MYVSVVDGGRHHEGGRVRARRQRDRLRGVAGERAADRVAPGRFPGRHGARGEPVGVGRAGAGLGVVDREGHRLVGDRLVQVRVGQGARDSGGAAVAHRGRVHGQRRGLRHREAARGGDGRVVAVAGERRRDRFRAVRLIDGGDGAAHVSVDVRGPAAGLGGGPGTDGEGDHLGRQGRARRGGVRGERARKVVGCPFTAVVEPV